MRACRFMTTDEGSQRIEKVEGVGPAAATAIVAIGNGMAFQTARQTREYDAVVIDSAPSRISPFGCPEEYDPIHHLPTDCSRIKIIIGLRDRVVLPEDSQDLASMAEGRGAEVLREPEFAHPFQDPSLETHRRRLHDIADFLTRWRP
jgi:hypothetical protein